MFARCAAFLSLCASVTAFTPRHMTAFMPAARLSTGRSAAIACKEQATQLNQAAVKLDPEMLKVVWAAAQASVANEVRNVRIDAAAQQIEAEQRVDKALAELAHKQAAARVASDFSEPLELQIDSGVPDWLTVSPPVIMGLSVVLFVLNTFGVFGEGPDLTSALMVN